MSGADDRVSADEFAVRSADGLLRITPTDVSSYVGRDQCRRMLRLKLYEKNRGGAPSPFAVAGVGKQTIPQLRKMKGAEFEDRIAASLVADRLDPDPGREQTSPELIEAARTLTAGRERIFLQVPLSADIAGWRVNGIADLVRLEGRPDGTVSVLIVDTKATARPLVEHRMQVAFYERMVDESFRLHGIRLSGVRLGILYRGPVDDLSSLDEVTRGLLAEHRAAAERVLGLSEGYLDLIEDPQSFREDVDRFVFAPDSHAATVCGQAFGDVPFHLTPGCDGCDYGEICMASVRRERDLSLIPMMTADQKAMLRGQGIRTVDELAGLMQPLERPRNHGPHRERMHPAPGAEAAVRRLRARRSLGPHLDQLAFRAQRLRAQADPGFPNPRTAIGGMPSTLPKCDAERNPNLITVYLNAASDPLTDRMWMFGALVTAARDGEIAGERSVVHIAPAPPDSARAEGELLIGWLNAVLRAVAELAQPDAFGERRAPIHLVLWSETERTRLLDVLRRHTEDAQGQTALAMFLDPAAMTETPLVTLLKDDVRSTRDYPLLCQTVQSVSTYLRFDWGESRRIFRERLFDEFGPDPEREGEEPSWVQARPRFSSTIPAEYAYAAWGDLAGDDERLMQPYRRATPEALHDLCERWLLALRHIAGRLRPDPTMEKAAFPIPELGDLRPPQASFAKALVDFLLVDRLAEVAEWKRKRGFTPEERATAGTSLLATYHAADQDPDVAERNAKRFEWNERRWLRYEAARQLDPAVRIGDALPGDDEDPEPARIAGERVVLRLAHDLCGVSLDEMLTVSELRKGSGVVLRGRWRRPWVAPDGEVLEFTFNPSQLLKGTRADILEMPEPGSGADGRIAIRMSDMRGSGTPPFTFGWFPEAFAEGGSVTLDEDPNNFTDQTARRTLLAIIGDGDAKPEPNTLVELLGSDAPPAVRTAWPDSAAEGRRRFLAGLDAMADDDANYRFEGNARRYIAEFGDSDLLLIQGPPGSGKSSTTAFALLARMQGALLAGLPMRICVSANTHAAVNVLLGWVAKAQATLWRWAHANPDRYREFFEFRLLDAPVIRLGDHEDAPPGVAVWPNPEKGSDGLPRPIKAVTDDAYQISVVGGTPWAFSKMVTGVKLAINQPFDLLVLDEASRMSLPEAVVAAKALNPRGRAIVVGDHRQMQPILARAWDKDPERAFDLYAPFRSVYDALADRGADRLPLEESFRIHRDVAEFLRERIYSRDRVNYRSRRTQVLNRAEDDHPFVAAALTPEHPLVLVRHGERDSQLRNEFEAELVDMLAAGLLRRDKDLLDGMGVVVPHRAQQATIGMVMARKVGPDLASRAFAAVDTVERFQGGERDAIVISATESDPQYLLESGGFLYDPNRLTVALSRARHKLVLVAAGSVFELFSPDSDLYERIDLWRSIPRSWCTVPLWRGMLGRAQIPVEVLGNRPGHPPAFVD